MIEMIFAAVAFVIGVYGAYLVGKNIGRKNGYYEGRRETYRDLEHTFEQYQKIIDANKVSTNGA